MDTAAVRSKAASHCLLELLLSVGFCAGSLFCGVVLGALSNFAIPVLRRRELVALLNGVLAVVWLFLPCVCLFLALLVCGLLLCGLMFEYVLSWPP